MNTTARPRKRRAAKVRPVVGSVRERHSSWFWETYVDGKQKMFKLGSTTDLRTKQAAVDAANAMHAKQQVTTSAANGDTVIRDFVDSVYLPWAERTLAPSTYRGYRRTWQNPIKTHFADLTFAQYRTGMASKFLDSLALSGLGKNTINHIRALMSGIFTDAASKDLIDANPIHLAKIRETVKAPEKTQHYSIAEMRAILAALDKDGTAREHAIMALSFKGLRRGEISGLQWGDVDLAAGVLSVRRSAWQGKARHMPKNEQSVRDVGIGPVLIASLSRLRRLYPDDGFVFANEIGGPLDLGVYSAWRLKPIFAVCNLVWKGYHARRRGAVTAQRDTSEARAVAANMGHSEDVLRKHYDKGNAEAARAAALAFDALLTDNNGQSVQ